MTPDEREWLRAIVAEPTNIPLRLVFADWLDEHGDADRSDYIRYQLLGRDSLPLPAVLPTTIRERNEMINQIKRNAVERFVAVAPDHLACFFMNEHNYHGGLLGKVIIHQADAEAFGEQLPELFKLAPIFILELGVHLWTETGRPEGGIDRETLLPLLTHSEQSRLEDLFINVANGAENDVAQALVRCPYLSRLHRLGLYWPSIDPPQLHPKTKKLLDKRWPGKWYVGRR